MTRDEIVEFISRELDRDMHVDRWPADEQRFYRTGDWSSFSDREAGLREIRARKIYSSIVDDIELNVLEQLIDEMELAGDRSTVAYLVDFAEGIRASRDYFKMVRSRD